MLERAVLNNLSQLTELKLNRNKISQIAKETFSSQEHLDTLYVVILFKEIIQYLIVFNFLESLIEISLKLLSR